MEQNPQGLSQLVSDVKFTLQSTYEQPVWVVAEINELNINRSGHCYLELIEKDSILDKIIAKSRATIWSFAFRNLKAFFETATGESFRAGLKVLLKVSVEFHEVYGFSLNVLDIDPNFTLGDLARKRAAVIQQLQDDGVLDLNQTQFLPNVPQRIAVISSETAAGYGDFLNQINSNSHGFKIFTQLFPAVMQGQNASQSIINAFNQIFDRLSEFDAVVLIRGGGSKSDLSCFDDYDLAYYITQFPLPVLTGIGHQRDDTVCDMVAHTRLKTPTAVAEFLLQKFADFQQLLDDYYFRLEQSLTEIFDVAEAELSQNSMQLKSVTTDLIYHQQQRIENNYMRIKAGVTNFCDLKAAGLQAKRQSLKLLSSGFVNHNQHLLEIRKLRLGKWSRNLIKESYLHIDLLQSKLEANNPEKNLKKGYAIVTDKTGVVKHAKNLKPGDKLHIQFYKGTAETTVTKTSE